MELIIITKNDCYESVNIKCSPSEWLIINKALMRAASDCRIAIEDRRKAEDMLNTQPVFCERKKE